MSDTHLITQLDTSRDPDPQAIEAARRRLAEEIQRPTAARRAPRTVQAVLPAWSRRLSRRPAWAAVGAAAAATALVGALTVSGALAPGQHQDTPGAANPASTRPVVPSTGPLPSLSVPSPSTTGTSSPEVDAEVFLRSAATAQRLVEQPDPRPDQFLYLADDSGYEAWLSMDGTRDGLVLSAGHRISVPGCIDGRRSDDGQPCTPLPAFQSDAPITAQAMAAYIQDQAAPSNRTLANPVPPSTNSIAKTLLRLCTSVYLRPDARAALLDAIPLLPGLTLDAARIEGGGDALTAVSWAFGSSTTSLIFDTATHAFLGVTSTGSPDANVAPTGGGAPVTLAPQAGGISFARQTVVDEVGDRA